MPVSFPGGMPIRRAGPRPISQDVGNIYQDLGVAAGQVGEQATDYYQQDLAEQQSQRAQTIQGEDRRMMMDNMIRKRQLAREIQDAKMEKQRLDMEISEEERVTKAAGVEEEQRRFEIGEARTLKSEESQTKAQDLFNKDWSEFTKAVVQARGVGEGGKANPMIPAQELKDLAVMHGVINTPEGRTRLKALGVDTEKKPDPFQQEKFDYTKSQNLIVLEGKIRNEFANKNKAFFTVGNAFNRIKASASDPSAAGDMALIFNFMKMLDPGSTVREGEFATAAAAGDFGDRIQGAANRLISGKRLSNAQRKDFMGRAGKLMGAANDGYQQSRSAYTELSESYGIDPRRVVIDLSRQSGTPMPSDADSSMSRKILEGDPSKKESLNMFNNIMSGK